MPNSKKIKLILAIAIMILVIVLMAGCNDDKEDETVPTQSEYTIYYIDDSGMHQFIVQTGKVYSIETIPSRTGYDFIGLFDAEIGGVQYINSSGVSLQPFNNQQDLVLYAQYAPKEYTLILDYGEAAVTDVREMTVKYGEEIPYLPTNLILDHYNFKGWYTAEDCQGTQIADSMGLLPSRKVVNETNFTISDGYIYLYAGFELAPVHLTFYVGSSSDPIEIDVPHGTSFSEVAIEAFVEGRPVLSWSTQSGDYYLENVFEGEITQDMVLYSAELGYTVIFNSNGAEAIDNQYYGVGDKLNLPQPEREGYLFLGWETTEGDNFSASVMPNNDVTLVARWEKLYSLTFNSNGGTTYPMEYKRAGSTISLPTPVRSGYEFVAWKTTSGTTFTEAIMPARDLVLVAAWNKIYNITFVSNGGSAARSINKTAGSAIMLPQSVKSGYTFDGWYTAAGERFTASVMPAADKYLYAHWVGEYVIDFTRYNCKDDNGYNINEQDGSAEKKSRHDGFELGKIIFFGAGDGNGNYYKPYNGSISLQFRTINDIYDLPRPSVARNGEVGICDDSYSGQITGTNISGKKINHGAYYIKVNYTDGSYTETNAVNFLANVSKGQSVTMAVNVDNSKTISSISIDIMYEIYVGAPGFLGIWWFEYTNWRLKSNIIFN